ncbi:MAG: DUF3303 family protein [Ginsengibacter sp.]
MIIEIFHPGKEEQLYKRLDEIGRQLPEGVHYIDSWIDEGITTCYQVMESDQEEKIREWVKLWADLADFKIVPVITSGEARKKVIAG